MTRTRGFWMRVAWFALVCALAGCAGRPRAGNAVDLPHDPDSLADVVRTEFHHAWEAYRDNAWGHDEWMPVKGEAHDWYGTSLRITEVDALDALILFGDLAEADAVRDDLAENLNFDVDADVQVFEVNIRLLGGLLSAYQITTDDRLLRLAEDLGRRLVKAFDSPTGMPYRMVNLRTGKASGAQSNPAEIGTCILEFGTLSRLTGDPVYYDAAKRALTALFARRSPIGLLGSSIDVETGEWLRTTSHIGGGIDSCFEYLWKGWVLFRDPDLKDLWNTAIPAVHEHLAVTVDGRLWYGRGDMNTGTVTEHRYGGLEAFFPGVLVMSGDVAQAAKLQESADAMWRVDGLEPDVFDFDAMKANPRGAEYPLRPEIIESAWYLHRTTGDARWLEDGRIYLADLMRWCRVKRGYAEVVDVTTKELADPMDSFFLTETLKYLYLLFHDTDPDVARFADAVFTTEAHPLRALWFSTPPDR